MTQKIRPDLPPLPPRWRHLPISDHGPSRGYPVPWFVDTSTGKPDFRVVRPGGVAEAWNAKTCWLCGHALGAYQAALVGPMCGINRTTAEPPQHRECAEYAARSCPFMTRPLAVRRERDMPEHLPMPGEGIKRNPGVGLVWISRLRPRPFQAGNGVLFELQEPGAITFWREGRKATRAEIDASIESGFPLLLASAEAEGPDAVAELTRMRAQFTAMLPAT